MSKKMIERSSLKDYEIIYLVRIVYCSLKIKLGTGNLDPNRTKLIF